MPEINLIVDIKANCIYLEQKKFRFGRFKAERIDVTNAVISSVFELAEGTASKQNKELGHICISSGSYEVSIRKKPYIVIDDEDE